MSAGAGRPRPSDRHTLPRARAKTRAAASSWWPALAIFTLTLVVYLPALSAGFIWDDDKYVTENSTLSSAEGLRRIWFEPGATPQYYPLVFTTFWIERHLYGLAPLGYHVVNLLLHGAGAVQLFFLLRRLALPGAWLAAALFALHPVQVESVAWVTERKNVLSFALCMAAALAYLRFESSKVRRWYAIALFAFIAALWSKTVSGSLPAVLLVVQWWRAGRVERRDVWPLLPFFALALALGWTTVWMEKTHVGAVGEEWNLSLVERLLVAGRAVWFYAGKLVWPHPLSFVYERWDVKVGSIPAWLALVSAVALIGTLYTLRARIGRGPLASALVFGGTLLPALGLFDVYPMRYSWVADHFQYHASAALFAFAGAVIAIRGGRWVRPVSAIVLLALTALTFTRVPIFHDLDRLWTDTLDRNPKAWMAYHNLAMLRVEEGRPKDALALYGRALAVRPDLAQSHFNHGSLLAELGRFDEARPALEEAVRLDPNLVEARNNLGNVYQQLGRPGDAIEVYRATVRLLPDYAPARRNLAYALCVTGEWREAIEQYRAAIQLEPNEPASLSRLAWALAAAPIDSLRDGRTAVALAERAVRLSRSLQTVQVLAAAYAEAGDFASATAAIKEAIRVAEASHQFDAAQEMRVSEASYRRGEALRIRPAVEQP